MTRVSGELNPRRTKTMNKATKLIIASAVVTAMAGCGRRDAAEPSAAEKRGTNLVIACLSKAGSSVPNVLSSNGDIPRQKTLQDFINVLNAQTWDEFNDIRDNDLYRKLEIITDIHLPGVDDPLLFIRMRNQGSICGTTIYILRRDAGSGKWRNIHPLEEGVCSDMELYPVDIGGRTRFLSVGVDFQSKLLTGYSVLDYKPETDEWVEAGEVLVKHSFQLSAEDAKWISEEQVSELVLGKREYDSGKIPLGDKTIELEKYWTSNGYLPDGYHVKVLDAGKPVWPEKDDDSSDSDAFVRGFLPVKRGESHFVVFLDYANCDTGLGITISVLDIQTLKIIHEHVAPVVSSLDLPEMAGWGEDD